MSRLDQRPLKFIFNGLFATLIHFVVFSSLYAFVFTHSAAISNGIGVAFGIAASYLGNRYFVFQSNKSSLVLIPKFLILYLVTALIHTTFIFLWTDMAAWNPYLGFIVATGVTTFIAYLGNDTFVFK